MPCHVWEKSGIVVFKKAIFLMAITLSPATEERFSPFLWRADEKWSLWLWPLTWIRNIKIDHGILIQLVCAWSILIFRCCGFSQQNPTSFVVWFKWCSVNEQLSNILHFILTVILFMKHFTKGDLPVLLRILRASEMKILSLKKLLKYYTTTPRQLIAHLSFSLLYRLN